MLPRLADRLDDMETVFGSESILLREHLPMAQASQTMQAYGFAAAPVDQKVLVEALSRLLGRTGQRLLQRVAAGRRVPVPVLLDYLAAGETIDEFLQGFTSVMRAQAIAFPDEAKDRVVETVGCGFTPASPLTVDGGTRIRASLTSAVHPG